jgi:hypothetical protein
MIEMSFGAPSDFAGAVQPPEDASVAEMAGA